MKGRGRAEAEGGEGTRIRSEHNKQQSALSLGDQSFLPQQDSVQ